MKTLFFGAGPLGILYAHLLHEAGRDVTVFARGRKCELLQKNEIMLVNGYTGEKSVPGFKVVDRLAEEDAYDLVVVLVRKNNIPPVVESLRRGPNLKNILFMGNNVLGFDDYLSELPREKVLFGFPGAGGGWKGNTVEYVDREAPNGNRMPVRIGEIDGVEKARTGEIRSLFESSEVPVEIVKDMDGWLKYHAAFVLPIGFGIYKHECDVNALAADKEGLRQMVRACKECGNVLADLGYTERQPFKFNLFYWMPEFVTKKIFRGIFNSRYAEVAFMLHAEAARDEFQVLADEFQSLIDKTNVATPNFDQLCHYLSRS